MVAARNAGYSLKEIDELDVSYLLDLLVTQVNLMNRNKKKTQKPNVRKATQADFDLM